MKYKNIECMSITKNGICILDRTSCVCAISKYCQCKFSHKHLK